MGFFGGIIKKVVKEKTADKIENNKKNKVEDSGKAERFDDINMDDKNEMAPKKNEAKIATELKSKTPGIYKSYDFYINQYSKWISELSHGDSRNTDEMIINHPCFAAYQLNETLIRDYKVYSNVSSLYYGSEKIYDNLKKVIVFTDRIEPEEEGRDVAVEGYNSYLFFAVMHTKKLKTIIETRDTRPVEVNADEFVNEFDSDDCDYSDLLNNMEQYLNFLIRKKKNSLFSDKFSDEDYAKIYPKYLKDKQIMRKFEKSSEEIGSKLDEKEKSLKQSNDELLAKIKEWDELYRTLISTLTDELTERYNFKTHPELLEKKAEELKAMYKEFVEAIKPLTEKYHN